MCRFASTFAVLALAGCATTLTNAPEQTAHLAFLENDYPAALAQARERHVPLFVDAWAPWCHSCVYFKEHVVNRPELARNQPRFVFLSVDTEQASSAAFLEKFPIETWPTLLVIDPTTETAALKWMGTGTLEEFEKLLADGEAAVNSKGGDDAEALLAKADRLYGERKPELAAQAYRAAVSKLKVDAPQRLRAIESLLNALYSSKQYEPCAQAAAAEAPAMPKGSSFLNTVGWGLSCASMAEGAPWRKDAVNALEPLAQQALQFDGVLADDRSGLYESLVDLRTEAGDEVGAVKLAKQWSAFLEGEAAKAKSPAARAVFDPHRLNAALAAKEPLRVEGALKQSEQDLPGDYNPPARLAIAYREAGRLDEALAAADRALKLVYGPRKLRVYETRASILAKKGELKAQRATLAEAVEYGKALPASQRPEQTVARLAAEVAKLPAP